MKDEPNALSVFTIHDIPPGPFRTAFVRNETWAKPRASLARSARMRLVQNTS